MINWASNTSLIKSGINEFNLSTRCVLPVSAYNMSMYVVVHFYISIAPSETTYRDERAVHNSAVNFQKCLFY